MDALVSAQTSHKGKKMRVTLGSTYTRLQSDAYSLNLAEQEIRNARKGSFAWKKWVSIAKREPDTLAWIQTLRPEMYAEAAGLVTRSGQPIDWSAPATPQPIPSTPTSIGPYPQAPGGESTLPPTAAPLAFDPSSLPSSTSALFAPPDTATEEKKAGAGWIVALLAALSFWR